MRNRQDGCDTMNKNWQFRKQQVADWQQVILPDDAKDVQIVAEDESYVDYSGQEPKTLSKKLYYVVWLEKVG